MLPTYMAPTDTTTRSLQKGSAEFLVLAVLDGPQRHGYEIAHLIELRSDGRLKFQAATLYPLLYKLEKHGWVEGRWVEKGGEGRGPKNPPPPRRRFYRLTAAGKSVLTERRKVWREFVDALDQVARLRHA
jgi:PadR family transcriptional regulator, regulatory protein PadR